MGFATGLDKKRSAKRLVWFEQAHEQIHKHTIQQRQAECPQEPALSIHTDLLLSNLFSYKLRLSYDLLGFTTSIDGSTAKRNQDIGQIVLEWALVPSGHAPKRSFFSVEEFNAYFYKTTIILIDATEQRTQRPDDSVEQKQL
ncbi:hypothetical protein [Spirosoma utsteinense]|uniref:Uncharacterized protein n=1 Tax=Spirosoma utsteinense TaxID=2585773 RepID=A0ABR6WDJ7_9BACT|nr:hypothetical protein [Spirosoma utsteinense]MBC3788535.1 hypothetical protein [Spirosoma utsteinense]MBC3788537.1 hypothetical protein [Spirosoma utsteinense]MBC3794571.1 hypothetical protein [Spirosoma utsteinense]MBC3794573.1 hypothetical protein [Spirosoma utsteinense]